MIEWAPDDARLPGLVDRLTAQLDAAPSEAWEQNRLPDDLADLLGAFFVASVPAARRILELLEQRGWTGWTNTTRIGQTGVLVPPAARASTPCSP